MQYNPYAPPQALPPQNNYAGGPQGGPQPWTVGEALNVGWTAVKTHFVTLIFSAIVSWIPAVIIGAIGNQLNKSYVDPSDPTAMFREPGYWGVTLGVQIPTMLITAFSKEV